MKYCDLHCHTFFSDGASSPEELVDLAVKANLSALALTDHNTLDGLDRFCKAADRRIEICRGCEITTDAEGTELHLLGLFLDPQRDDKVREALRQQFLRKEESNRITIDRLVAAGYDISFEEFIEDWGSGVKNRVHIAKYLMKKGIIKSIDEAFDGLLKKGGKFAADVDKLDFYQMISLIREAGGVAVWAHPLFHVNREQCEHIVRKALSYGLDGVEVYYTTYTEDDMAYMKDICQKYGLLESGGSDFHGENKPGVAIGVGYGNLSVPYTCYENLKQIYLERK